MDRSLSILLRVVGLLIIATAIYRLVYPALRRPRIGSRQSPRYTILNNLVDIEQAKEILQEKNHLTNGYWPTRAELAVALGRAPDARVAKPSRWGEVYIPNQIGAPAYAYLSNAVASFPEGCLLTVEDLSR